MIFRTARPVTAWNDVPPNRASFPYGPVSRAATAVQICGHWEHRRVPFSLESTVSDLGRTTSTIITLDSDQTIEARIIPIRYRGQ